MMTVLKALQIIKIILEDLIKNDGKTLIFVVMGVISIFFAFFMFVLMPVIIHERVPIASREQAMYYFDGARKISASTVSPCDDGVQIEWQEVMAIDAVRLKQNFKKSSAGRAESLAKHFIEEDGTCTHCTGEGEDQT